MRARSVIGSAAIARGAYCRVRPFGSFWLVALALLLVAAPAAPAVEYGDRAVRYWLDVQLPSGAFPAIPEMTPAPHYGNTMMALALALRGHDEAAVRAVQHWIDHPPTVAPHPPFNALAALRTRRALGAAAPTAWDAVLRRRMALVADVYLADRYLGNWSLVAAAAAIEADRAGLGSYERRVVRFLRRQYLPQIRSGYGGDLGAWPLAYHAFGLAWLAHVAHLTGDRALIAATVQGCRVLVRMTTPMGRVAWYGRSYEESFAQAAAVYALRRCERFHPPNAGRYERTAVAALAMLRREHPTIHGPLAIVPRMRFAQTIARDGTDNYAHLQVYNGLTLALLALAPPATVTPAGPPPDVVLGETELDAAGGPGLVTLRHDRSYLAISLRRARSATDGRYGFGVHRAEQARRPLVPAMSRSAAPDFDLESATAVSLAGRSVVARGPGYRLAIRLDGCTVVETLTVTAARSVVVGARLPLERGEVVEQTAAGWRSSGGFVRVGAPFTRLSGTIEAGSDRYRTAVLRARVAVAPGRPLRVARGVAC